MRFTIASLLLSALMATATPIGSAANCADSRRVNPGDSCWSIASGAGLSIQDFYRINGGSGAFGGHGCPALQIGATVCLRG
ncbi:hypothetical protein EJ08DRAFT_703749 [Tothia fuscella]|uniref:LysM domain-containing protein n=1 Tax=Tothia fuscella TaxID=1048955 RepID=A0A9P4NDR0_9PEZI|nr:hypothetical protein EJ08DRAFT_703749 [Tothia fuscella]